jgi:hypothetical protein
VSPLPDPKFAPKLTKTAGSLSLLRLLHESVFQSLSLDEPLLSNEEGIQAGTYYPILLPSVDARFKLFLPQFIS